MRSFWLTLGIISIALMTVIGTVKALEIPVRLILDEEMLEGDEILGARSTTREWVNERNKKLIRSLTSTLQTLIVGDGTTSTTTNATLELKGSFAMIDEGSGCAQYDADGLLTSTGSACSGSASFSSNWQESPINVLTPTNTSAGIFVNASSTIDGDFTFIGDGDFQGSASTTGSFYIAGELDNLATINDTTYSSLQDWFDTTQSAGKIDGGEFSSNGDGEMTVAAGRGIIKIGTTATSSAMWMDWTATTTLELVDGSTSYIHVDYNGGDPSIHATIDKSTVNNRNGILLGKVFREGNTLHMVPAGMNIAEVPKNTLGYVTQVFGEVVRASGAVISESGTRNLESTAGVLWAGLTRITTDPQDTSGADTYESYIYTGSAWEEFASSTVTNIYYNDITEGSVELTPNRWGVHWVYIDGDTDGIIMVVMGQGDYTLLQAEAAQPPSSLPDHVADLGFLAAKILIQKDETNFNDVQSAYDTQFTSSGASVHNELSGLQGGTADQYFHLNTVEHTELTEWIDDAILGSNGDLTVTSATTTAHFSADATLYVKDGNVGIGTQTPTTQLQVEVDTDGEVRIADFLNVNADPDDAVFISVGVGLATNDGVVLGYNEASNFGYVSLHGEVAGDALTIADNGNIGIGTTTPLAVLDIVGQSNAIWGGRNMFYDKSAVPIFEQGKWDGGTNFYTSRIQVTNDPTGSFSLLTIAASSNKTQLTEGTMAEGLTVTGQGRVGVATTSPYATLAVEGDGVIPSIVTVDSAGNQDFIVQGDGRAGFSVKSLNVSTDADDLVIGDSLSNKGMTILGNTQSNLFFGDAVTTGGDSRIGQIRYLHTADSMIFRAGGNDHFFITANGNIGIGTSTPDVILQVEDTSEQLRLSYDWDSVASFTVAGDGDMTIDLNTANATTTFPDDIIGSNNIEALQFCLTGDDCIATWPSGTDYGASWEATTTPGFEANTITPTTTAASVVWNGRATSTETFVIGDVDGGLRIIPGQTTTTLEFF